MELMDIFSKGKVGVTDSSLSYRKAFSIILYNIQQLASIYVILEDVLTHKTF